MTPFNSGEGQPVGPAKDGGQELGLGQRLKEMDDKLNLLLKLFISFKSANEIG